MRFCGIKVTHDGAVAVIEDGRLVCSYESEKIANRHRYSKLQDVGEADDILGTFGLSLRDMDAVALDGWHRTRKSRSWRGIELELTLGPYRDPVASTSLMAPHRGRIFDLEYLSFSHYAGHVAASYCTSPFAEHGEPALVLSWDGLMYPFLYECNSDVSKVETLASLFPLVGNAYPALAGSFPPFDARSEGPHNLGLAGKIMAYAALGRVRNEAVRHIAEVVDRAHAAVVQASPFGTDIGFQFDQGSERLAALADHLRLDAVPDADMIASVDHYMGRRLVDSLARLVEVRKLTCRNLCLAGGTALNINWNQALRECGLFDTVWVPPFPNDSGGAIGAACCAMACIEGRSWLEWDVYSGPPLQPTPVEPGWGSRPCSLEELARLLHTTGDPVIFLTGRAELGPRALGHRSILAPATDPGIQARLNEMKARETYRPVAPVCLAALAPEVFDPGTSDPYMLFSHMVRPGWRDRVPAVCHVDGSARLQTVTEQQEPAVAEVLTHYHRLSGVPLLCNTSANFKDRGFFPDVASAMRWGRIPSIWSEGTLYARSDP